MCEKARLRAPTQSAFLERFNELLFTQKRYDDTLVETNIHFALRYSATDTTVVHEELARR